MKLASRLILIICFFTSFVKAQTNCDGIATWNSTAVYYASDKVVFQDHLYMANWYSQNQNPLNNSGQWEVWTSLGQCSTPPATVKFKFPLEVENPAGNFSYWNIGGYPDQDPGSDSVDYAGGNAAYNGHRGMDIGLGANGWTRMDDEIVNVIAAADGVIVKKEVNQYDRRCSGSVPIGEGNYIKIKHNDTLFTIYAHLKKGTLTSKAEGSFVAAGEYLGKVGSSGNSSGPHLHFEVRNNNEETLFPNNLDPAKSLWETPLAYLPSAMPDIIVTDENISYIDSCSPEGKHDFQSEFFTRKGSFFQGETVKIFRFYNNTRINQPTNQQLIRPDGSEVWNSIDNIDVNWQVLIWVSEYSLPQNALTGIWTFREVYNGVTYESTFEVKEPNNDPIKFDFPLEVANPENNFVYWNIGSYPDRDPGPGHVDYTGGTSTYNNHHGTDIGLGANGWTRMDDEIVNVIAAASGEIVEKRDNEYDRRCSGSVPNGEGNYIKIKHNDTLFTIFAHLKTGTLTTKPVGSMVTTGEFLGKVGSSGNSSGPHLHFDVRNENNGLIDPNHVDPSKSLWATPLPYLPSAMPDIIVSDEDINYIDSCAPDGTHDFQSEFFTRKESFFQGETVKIFRYYNNTRDNQTTNQQLIRPDGSSVWNTTDNIDVNWQILIKVSQHILPANAQVGTWTFKEIYNGITYESKFEVKEQNNGCNLPEWISSNVYYAGDEVKYNGNGYQANWSMQNQPNPEITIQWGAWTLLGPCSLRDLNLGKNSEFENNHTAGKLSAYPNPSSTSVKLNLNGKEKTNLEVRLISLDGRIIFVKNESVIDVSQITSGIYILHAKSDFINHRERIIVE